MIFQEQLKSSSQPSKRKERAQSEDEDGEHSEKKRRKGGKKKRKDKHEKSHYETEEVEADRGEFQEDMDEQHNDYEEPTNQLNTVYDDEEEDMAQDPRAAAGLEDSDVEDEMVISLFHFVLFFSIDVMMRQPCIGFHSSSYICCFYCFFSFTY